MDALFLLPHSRLRYYSRLYNKLLKSATEGRSDHRMLQHATAKLGRILASIEERLRMDANQVERHGEEEVLHRVRTNNVAREPQREEDLSSSGTTPEMSEIESQDKGRNKLEEERRSVAKWEQQKRNKAGGSQDAHHS